MKVGDDSALRELQDLRQQFREQLPARIQRLSALWRDLVGGGWAMVTARDMQFLLHGLAGSAGTHGFPRLSSAAAEAELKLDSLCANGDAPGDAHMLEMRRLMEALQHIAVTEKPQLLVITQSAANAKRGLIYLLDDDDDFASSTALQLVNFGYEVRIFRDADAMEVALHKKTPDAVLVDIILDGQPLGTLIAQRLREVLPEVPPLVFISVRDDLESRLGAVRAGCSAYFTKPIDVGMLVDCLDGLTGVRLEEPYRVLLVDDSPLDAAAYSRILQNAGLETVIVTDPMTAMRQLCEFMPDLILMDLKMPECSGVELAAVIRQQDIYLAVPIVFLSAEANRSRQLSAMKKGGDDFLTKPIQPEHLVALVRSRAERGRVLNSAMVRDSLTGLLNHNRVSEQLATEIARAARYRSDLSVAMIDIDHFKSVNDAHGHLFGDRVIKSLAWLLLQRLRTTDIVGRYGGEEFIAILIGAQAEQAREIMDQIRADFSMVRHRAGREELSVSYSCGIASFPQFGAGSQLVDAADRALYAAKRAGRNRVVVSGQALSHAMGATTPGPR